MNFASAVYHASCVERMESTTNIESTDKNIIDFAGSDTTLLANLLVNPFVSEKTEMHLFKTADKLRSTDACRVDLILMRHKDTLCRIDMTSTIQASLIDASLYSLFLVDEYTNTSYASLITVYRLLPTTISNKVFAKTVMSDIYFNPIYHCKDSMHSRVNQILSAVKDNGLQSNVLAIILHNERI